MQPPRVAEHKDLTNIPGTKTRGRVQQEQPVADKVDRLLEVVVVAAKGCIQVRKDHNAVKPEEVRRERAAVH